MKIGVLTFHCAHNYGAMLQTYATQKLLEAAGHQVEIIDYRPSYLTEPFKRLRLSRIRKTDGTFSLRHLLAEILLLPFRFVRYAAFDRFMKRRLNLTGRVYPDTFACTYDVIVFGSDQVWNIRQTGGSFDRMYFGDFKSGKGKCRYVADAVSLETDMLGEEHVQYLRQVLPGFDALSARERTIADWLSQYSSSAVMHIQDPVIQLDPVFWRELAGQNPVRKPYLLLYNMMQDDSIRPFAVRIAKERGLEVIEIKSVLEAKDILRARQAVGVEDFVSLFASASFVVTSSFHGTAFSIIFRKPFYCFSFGNSKDLRAKSLLESAGLSERMLPVGSEVPSCTDIDYTETEPLIEKMRARSASFMIDSITER